MIIGKARPSWYICLITSLWGVVSMSQGFIKNFAELLSVRFILGLVEAPFLPAVFVLMSCWYSRAELPPCIAILYGGNMISAAFSGLIGAGITSQMDGVLGRYAWEWLFIIEGSVTVALALLLLPLLPDYPLQSKHLFLTREHQLICVRQAQPGVIPSTC